MSILISTLHSLLKVCQLILEKKNLVVRVSDQLDKRVNRIILTTAGKQLFNDVLPIMNKTKKEVTHNLSQSDMRTFKDVLTKIIENLINE